MSRSIREMVEIDIGFAACLAILWLRPLGPEGRQEIPTLMVGLAAFVVGTALAIVLFERRLPTMRSRRDPTRQVKKKQRIAGFVVGLVVAFAAEVATGFAGPANFAAVLGMAAMISYLYATMTVRPITM